MVIPEDVAVPGQGVVAVMTEHLLLVVGLTRHTVRVAGRQGKRNERSDHFKRSRTWTARPGFETRARSDLEGAWHQNPTIVAVLESSFLGFKKRTSK